MRKTIRENPGTLKGKLQRGHGAGYLDALQTPPDELAPILIDCICNDARLDRQCESRSSYYASLTIKTQTDISGLGDYLRLHDDIRLNDGKNNGNALGILLILATLGVLAKKGNIIAVQILRDYVSYGGNWCCAVSNLTETEESDNLEGIDRVICCRYKNDDDLIRSIEAQYWIDTEFFNFIRQSNTRLAKIADMQNFDDWNPNKHEAEEKDEIDYGKMSLNEVFDMCDNDNRIRISKILEPKLKEANIVFLGNMLNSGTDYQKAVAAHCLGVLGTSQSFAYLKNFLEDTSKGFIDNSEYEKRFICASAIRNIANAPSEVCLETGRRWFLSANYPENVAGWQILEEHATINDIPMLKKAIYDALETEDDKLYLMYSAIEALANFENIGLVSELEEVYHRSICSLGRRRAAEMMCDLAPVEFTVKYAYECLYDCEAGTKLIGIEMVNIAEAGVYQRLSELSEDLTENEEVRRQAKERLV